MESAANELSMVGFQYQAMTMEAEVSTLRMRAVQVPPCNPEAGDGRKLPQEADQPSEKVRSTVQKLQQKKPSRHKKN